jgi:hypothetical protein
MSEYILTDHEFLGLLLGGTSSDEVERLLSPRLGRVVREVDQRAPVLARKVDPAVGAALLELLDDQYPATLANCSFRYLRKRH